MPKSRAREQDANLTQKRQTACSVDASVAERIIFVQYLAIPRWSLHASSTQPQPGPTEKNNNWDVIAVHLFVLRYIALQAFAS